MRKRCSPRPSHGVRHLPRWSPDSLPFPRATHGATNGARYLLAKELGHYGGRVEWQELEGIHTDEDVADVRVDLVRRETHAQRL